MYYSYYWQYLVEHVARNDRFSQKELKNSRSSAAWKNYGRKRKKEDKEGEVDAMGRASSCIDEY